MPYMHSESAIIHLQAERLFASLGPSESYDSELRHKAIIDRFGRFPHRNELLGRQSTAEELAFLLELRAQAITRTSWAAQLKRRTFGACWTCPVRLYEPRKNSTTSGVRSALGKPITLERGKVPWNRLASFFNSTSSARDVDSRVVSTRSTS
jgi:hypothetical protein